MEERPFSPTNEGVTAHQGICWQDTSYLRMYGLYAWNALDYFSRSPFYDRHCNNELLRMQGLGYSNPQAMESLLNMVGLEYKLLLVDGEAPIFEDLQQLQQQPEMPRLIVIRQCMRSTRVHVEVQAIYYILHGTVYQCPSVESVLSSRLRKAAYLLDSALIELESFAKLDSKMCYTWNNDWQAEEDITTTTPAQKQVPLPSSIYDRSIMGILEEDRQIREKEEVDGYVQ